LQATCDTLTWNPKVVALLRPLRLSAKAHGSENAAIFLPFRQIIPPFAFPQLRDRSLEQFENARASVTVGSSKERGNFLDTLLTIYRNPAVCIADWREYGLAFNLSL
jgi:hypothetical protein